MLAITIGGCKRCYYCGSFVGSVLCVNNGDTIHRTAFGSSPTNDTIAYYSNMGYTCYVDTGWVTTWTQNPVCGVKNRKDHESAGMRCVDWHENP